MKERGMKNCVYNCSRLDYKNADKIIVLEDGQIVETGTHDELINKLLFKNL